MIKRIFFYALTKVLCVFSRSLSFTSAIEYSRISNKSKIWGHCKIFHSEVDDYSYIGRYTRLIYVKVGKFCSIAGECSIGMGSHSIKNISTSSIFTSKRNGIRIKWTNINSYDEYEPVVIGNDVWIGYRAMIMGGVNIGNGAIIGAGAIVTKDVPPYAIVGGVPAKIIRYRFSEEINKKLDKTQWWLLDDNILKDNIEFFQHPLDGDIVENLVKISKENLL